MLKRSTRAAVSAAAAAAAGSSRKFAYATKPTRRLPLVAAAVAIGGAVFAATSTASAAPAPKIIRVAVGTQGASKVKAVENAFKDMYGSGVQIDCNGVKDVKSFVSDQPVSDFETQTGALNRARNARAMLAAANDKADFYVEGGFCPMPALEEPAPKGNFYLQNELHNFTWVVVLQDGSSKVGASRSASFQLPGCLHEGLLQGKELGQADAAVFKRTVETSKHSGTVDLLTNGNISREFNITQACKLALIPFMGYNREWFASAPKSSSK